MANGGENVLFKDVVEKLMKRVENEGSKKGDARMLKAVRRVDKRITYASGFFKWYKERESDLYPLLRLIFPSSDRNRGVYKIKEKVLGTLLAKCFNVENTDAGKRLIDFKDTRFNRGNVGRFADTAKQVRLERQGSNAEGSDMSIKQLNDILDELAQVAAEKHSSRMGRQKRVLDKFVDLGLSAEEWKWVSQIILGSVSIHMAEKTILNLLHPNGYELLTANNDIKSVAELLNHPEQIKLEQPIAPGNRLQPHTAKLETKGKGDTRPMYDVVVEKMKKKIGHSGMYLEEKLDGYRMQCHITSTTEEVALDSFVHYENDVPRVSDSDTRCIVPILDENGESSRQDGKTRYKAIKRRFQYFYRSGREEASLSGDNTVGWVSPHLDKMLPVTTESAIFDGECIAYDSAIGKALTIGNIKGLTDLDKIQNPDQGLRYMIFDIIYHNGWDLRKQALCRRKAVLLQLLKRRWDLNKESLNRVDILPFNGPLPETAPEFSLSFGLDNIPSVLKPFKADAKMLAGRMQAVVENSTEGLIVKEPASEYKLDARDDWYKLKPEYVNEMTDLDLIVLGAYHGQGSRGGKRASYLMGVRNEDSNDFWTLCKVGGGFTFAEYNDIEAKLCEHFRKFDRSRLDFYYDKFKVEFMRGGGKSGDWPDEIIDPKKSMVFKVKASEIIESSVYRCGMTLRFQRFQAFAEDRTFENCTTYYEISERKDAGSTLHNIANTTKGKKRAKFRKKKTFINAATTSQKIEAKQGERYLSPQVFHLSGFTVSADRIKLQEKILQYGGRTDDRTKLEPETKIIVVAPNDPPMAARNMAQQGITVVKQKYIDDCIFNQKLLLVDSSHLYMPKDPTNEAQLRLAKAQKNQGQESGVPWSRQMTGNELLQYLTELDLGPGDPEKTRDLMEWVVKNKDAVYDEFGLILAEHRIYIHSAEPGVTQSVLRSFKESDYELVNQELSKTTSKAQICGARIVPTISESTLVVVHKTSTRDQINSLKMQIRQLRLEKERRIVTHDYVLNCYNEGTLLPEERFTI